MRGIFAVSNRQVGGWGAFFGFDTAEARRAGNRTREVIDGRQFRSIENKFLSLVRKRKERAQTICVVNSQFFSCFDYFFSEIPRTCRCRFIRLEPVH